MDFKHVLGLQHVEMLKYAYNVPNNFIFVSCCHG